MSSQTINGFNIDIIGYIGAFLLSTMFIPQVYQIYNTKNTQAISYYSQFISLLSSLIMLIYGVLLNSIPIMISNSSIILCVGAIIYLKYKFESVNRSL
jgi:MtN3 and saliva related transmembrane protein